MKAIYLSLLVLAAACTAPDPTHSFGVAARTIVTRQAVNPSPAAAPVVEAGDSYVTKSAVDALRRDAEPKDARPNPR